MWIVSACLAGVDCKYNGGNNIREEILKLASEGKAILVCPEQLGGLSTPRKPSEIICSDGSKVLTGEAKVKAKDGEDVTDAFIKGAEETLKIAQLYGITKAILKARSPSCGSHQIYDGSFSGGLKDGDGVTAALLKSHGIQVVDEEDFREGMRKA